MTVTTRSPAEALDALVALGDRLAAADDLEAVIDTVLSASAALCGAGHGLLLLHHAETGRLVTMASHGYPDGGAGSEVALGEGVIGSAAQSRRPIRVGNVQRLLRYATSAARREPEPPTSIALPGLADARSQLAVPLVTRGELVGVLAVESPAAVAFDDTDQHALALAGHLAAAHVLRAAVDAAGPSAPVDPPGTSPPSVEPVPSAGRTEEVVAVRHYVADGSTFLDGGYVIKGVAGRLLWKLLSEHDATGRVSFTNREVKLDPALDLPPHRDNFESRLILLKRRLVDRGDPIAIVSTGRGRFDLAVRGRLVLERVDP